MKKWKMKREDGKSNKSYTKKKREIRNKYFKSKSIKSNRKNQVKKWIPYKAETNYNKRLSNISNNTSLGSLNKPPMFHYQKFKNKIKNQKKSKSKSKTSSKINKNTKSKSIQLYTNRKKELDKSVQSQMKKSKTYKSKKKKSKTKSKKRSKSKKLILKQNKNVKNKRTYTNKFESTKKAFEYAKDKLLNKTGSRRYW